jgi:ABC-2 type transport system ATP-binding protein
MSTADTQTPAQAEAPRGRETGTPAPAVLVRGVRKAYGQRLALDGVDLTIGRGEVVALLGPNGAGKTTLIEILEGHRRPDAGMVSVLGFAPDTRSRRFREQIGIVSQEGGHVPTMTVAEAVRTYSAAYPRRKDSGQALELVGLADAANARIGALSGGQRRRLDLALAVAGNPELLFLDEPTTGFDPSARRRAWALVGRLRALGTTILLTTHYMDEAQRLADRVAVIVAGRIVAEGPPDAIGGAGPSTAVLTFRLPAEEGVDELPLPVAAFDQRERLVTVETGAPTRDSALLTGWAAGRGMELLELTVTRPSLEAVYLHLTDQEEPR